MDLPKAYNPKEVEGLIYERWERSGFFAPEAHHPRADNPESQKTFCIVMPPPNVTGTLHMGHALMATIEDILIRWRRMQGRKTLWLPGTDHAAIATQTKVEKLIEKKEGKRRHDLGREEFLKRVDKFAKESHDTIISQLKSMGASCDWSREAFTLDEQRNLAVRTAFKKLYDLGLIYRAHRVINWDVKGQTTISDDEVIYVERTAKLYTFKYSNDFPIAISTTRPETKLGDTAVAVHPDDARYKKYIGKEYDINFCGTKLHLKIIADSLVDKDFGTGALGVTPAHSMADFEMAQRHDLPLKQIIDERGKMTVGTMGVADKKSEEARAAVAQWLKDNNLMEKEEDIKQNVATAERTGGIIEPLPKLQWFINVNKEFTMPNSELKGIKTGEAITLKKLMRHTVESEQIKIIPEHFAKTFFHWIDNLRDWCISRQIWFGHQIPVWYKTNSKLKIQNSKLMGFYEGVVPQVFDGKTVTWRLRDHNFKVGDRVLFENSQTAEIFGIGEIANIEETIIEKINLKGQKHWATYKNTDELITAFKRHYPDREVTPKSKVWIYEYKFEPYIHVDIEPPKGEGPASAKASAGKWEQDPDTLDTWFSSGLWTFSTLGWPEQTKDLKTFHPTDVLETGYDILFFWVARMILMTTALTGQIPFKIVFLHGIIRDAEKKKMSKSKGNVIDPLIMTEKYGTDALRFALIFNTAPGTDMALAEDKIKGMKHFANKLWNVGRFVLTNLPPHPSSPSRGEDKGGGEPKIITAADREILEKLDQTIKAVTENLEKFNLHEAAQAVYDFTWHEFADKYIEASKEQLKTEELKNSTQAILLQSQICILKLLHPFMPFVTEHIWSIIADSKDKKDLLMIQPWPVSGKN